ncbi:MAG: alpha/beta hydrolase family protein, partial [Cyanobium sp.]
DAGSNGDGASNGPASGPAPAGGMDPASIRAPQRLTDAPQRGGPAAEVPPGTAERGEQTVVVVAEGGRSLWRLDLPADPDASTLVAPVCLTPPAPSGEEGPLFGDGLIDAGHGRWIGVCEQDGRDQLVSVPLAGGAPALLWDSPGFCGYAVLSPCRSHLAWVSWSQPCMPWDRSQLWLGRFDATGALVEARAIAGSAPGDAEAVSVFQPLWADADLVVANDRSGWWNLERLEAAERLPPGAEPPWRTLLAMQADFGMPQWVYGMRTTAWDGHQLMAAACRDGRWELGVLPPAEPAEAPRPQRRWQPIPLPFDDLACLNAENGTLVAIASGPLHPPGLLELNLQEGDGPPPEGSAQASGWQGWTHRPAAASPLTQEQISRPEPLWFAGHGNRRTHAWYYPPRQGASAASPLLVRGHSGPTAMARTGLNLAIQFWTSRSWGVVDVNYGGSTGFGRAYRERLDGGWGIVDVDDCLAAARAVVASGRADPTRIAMEGSSASGFTVLAAMARGDTIRAGAVRYPVTDLTALAEGDHRFEARYFDALVGPWPEARALYEERSPLNQVGRIEAPLLFFHGLEDTVVPAQQSIAMASGLRGRGVPVELDLFEGEGHGFRSGVVQRRVLERTEAFFRTSLGLP